MKDTIMTLMAQETKNLYFYEQQREENLQRTMRLYYKGEKPKFFDIETPVKLTGEYEKRVMGKFGIVDN